MQVKKFEARSMKEALEMVKRQLGPDAIILSARDHRKSFGLVGDGSVEITAAVAEETLHKKKFAESRMKPELREKFLNSPARTQRLIMEQFVQHYQEEEKPTRPATSRRYIDIEDEGQRRLQVEADSAESRIKDAAMRAWDAMREHEPKKPSAKSVVKAPTESTKISSKPRIQVSADISAVVETQASTPATYSRNATAPVLQNPLPPLAETFSTGEQGQMEITALKNELAALKTVLTDFQKVPQSFLGHHPGAAYGIPYDFSASFEKLTQAGLSDENAVMILEEAQEQLPKAKHKSRGIIDGFTAKYILDTTEVTGEKPKARVQFFVGSRGSGKTSSLVKMASHAVVDGNKKVALLTADTLKVGAIDQMRIYAQILNVPFGVIRKGADWKPILDQLKDYELIFCDFPGLSLKSIEEISMLKSLMGAAGEYEAHLVLSACSKDSDTAEICRRYESVRYDNLIFNHLDEALAHGTIYNMTKKFEKPLHSFGVGPRVPEDFEFATKERVLDLIFKLSKIKKVQEPL